MKFTSRLKPGQVIVHADDFGIGKRQSRRILDCARKATGAARVAGQVANRGVQNAAGVAQVAAQGAKTVAGGALNSLSVLVTSPHYRECAELLREPGCDLSVGLHVNLVEGHCAADVASIPLLVNGEGVFKRGFGSLLLVSIVHPRASRAQLQREIGAQIDLFLQEFPHLKERLRVDSHQHFHMIPAVFDALVSAIQSSDCTVEYMRVPAEPLLPFLRSRTAHLVPPINWVKHGVLNTLWFVNKRKVPQLLEHTAVFCGICFSGCMTSEHVGRIASCFKEYAAAKHMPVEFLFHPGGVESSEECLNPGLPGFVDFYLSPNRGAEAAAVKALAL